MTNNELQQAIAANTAAIGALVTQFIRPNAQQALENQRSVAQLIELMDRHARAIIEIDERLEANIQQIAANAEQIAANSSRIAQLSVKQDQVLDRIDEQQARTTESLNLLIEENRAFRESQQSQLAAIISNGRRIDRIEQRAS